MAVVVLATETKMLQIPQSCEHNEIAYNVMQCSGKCVYIYRTSVRLASMKANKSCFQLLVQVFQFYTLHHTTEEFNMDSNAEYDQLNLSM